MTHLLVTNDFPPKVGGIQNYLWELWSRLEPSTFAVLTASSDPGAAAFDAEQRERGVRIVRTPGRVLLPTPGLVTRVRQVAQEIGASLVLIDPAIPLGPVGLRLGLPYGVVLHGAEVAVPARLPVTRETLRHVVQGASLIVAAGGYPAEEAHRLVAWPDLPVVEVPPGVDAARFAPLDARERCSARRRLGIEEGDLLISSVSRLVPRKGMDVLIEAVGRLVPSFPRARLVIAGDGRDRGRLARIVRSTGAPARLLGRVSERDKVALLGASDVFVMACRSRWWGLEQEGFGLVFLEAAAMGVPQIAGQSGGAHEAVDDGVTGLVVDRPHDAGVVAHSLRQLLSDESRRREMGLAARRRVETDFDYARLAPRLASALGEVGG